jgi:hypothetical protein
MPAPQVTPVQRIKGLEFGGYFTLKPDYKESPIKEAAEKLLIEDARAALSGRGKQKIVLLRGFDGLRRPIVGWTTGARSDHPGVDVISEHTIDTGETQ